MHRIILTVPPDNHVERMDTPGARMSTTLPKLEKVAKRSELSVAPTV